MAQQGRYIYGIMEEPSSRRFGSGGVGEAEVYAINHQKLAAAVSDTELAEIDPTRKNVLAHTMVQDRLLKEYALLPMGFGMIAGGEDEVRKLLVNNYLALEQELTRLTGMVEVAVKVFWDQQSMAQRLQGESGDLARLKARIKAAASPVEAQGLLIQAGRLVERMCLDWKARYVERVYDSLRRLSVDARLNAPLGVKNLLNASFLIARSRQDEFQKEVYKLDSHYQGQMNFKYVGPLPPYNFVGLKLEPAKCC